VGDTVTLDGTGSHDVDGDFLTYSWSFTSKPSGSTATLDTIDPVHPTFVVDMLGSYVVQLMVNDGTVNSAADAVSVNILNSPPVADAGPDQTVFVGDTVTLDGTGSIDVDGDWLSYNWSFTSKPTGSTATLDTTDPLHPTFVVDVAPIYVVQLIVNDGIVDGTPDTLIIVVNDLDSDNDGMPDSWEQANGLDPYISDGVGDLDGDGFTNLVEYTRGTAPNDPNSHPPRSMPWIPLLLLDN